MYIYVPKLSDHLSSNTDMETGSNRSNAYSKVLRPVEVTKYLGITFYY